MGNSSSSSSFYYSNSKVNSNINITSAGVISNSSSSSSSSSVYDTSAAVGTTLGNATSTPTSNSSSTNNNVRRNEGEVQVDHQQSIYGGSTIASASTATTATTSSYNSGSATASFRRNIIVGGTPPRASSSTNSLKQQLPQPQQHRQPLHWKGPFCEVLQPQEAATLLGPSATRRIIRAFRRVIALNQPYYYNRNSTNNSSTKMDNTKYLHHGIYCYEDTAATNVNHIMNTNDHTGAATTAKTAATSTASITPTTNMELIFFNEEHSKETKEIDTILEWFFPTGSKSLNHPPNLNIDFLSFRHLILPPHISPPNGIVDCIFTSMATTVSSRRPTNNTTAAIPSLQPTQTFTTVVKLPDYLSFVAIVQYGTFEQRSTLLFKVYQSLPLVRNNTNTTPNPDATSATTSNSTTTTTTTTPTSSLGAGASPQYNTTTSNTNNYSKEPPTSVVSRDTITRFIYNIYGNDILQSETTQHYLNDLFGMDSETTTSQQQQQQQQQDSTLESSTTTTTTTTPTTNSSSSISLQQFVQKMTTGTTTTTTPTLILIQWLKIFTQYTMCPPPPSDDIVQMEEFFSTMTRKLQITCARYSLTPIMMLECKRKFYSILQLADLHSVSSSTSTRQQPTETTTSTIKQSQQQQQKHISLSKYLTVMEFLLPQSLAILTFSAGSSSACCCPIHRRKKKIKKSDATKNRNLSAANLSLMKDGSDVIPFGNEQRDVTMDQSNSFSTLHRTYSAVHPQGFALDMMSTIESTNSSSCCTSTAASTAAVLPTNAASFAMEKIINKSTVNIPKQPSTTALDEISSCTCSWTLYDSIIFSCSAIRTSCTSTSPSQLQPPPNTSLHFQENLPLLQFVFRVFSQPIHEEDSEECYIWTEDWWIQDEEEISTKTEPSLSKQQIGRMILLLLEHFHFRNQIDNFSTSTRAEVGEKDRKENEIFIIHDSQICVFRRAVRKMGLLPIEEEEKSHRASQSIIPLKQVVQTILRDFCPSSSRMTFNQFVEWHHSEKKGQQFSFRLGLYLQELRLVAGVVFGVRPSNPKVEREVILELFRRHQLSHPESPSNPRGPPGTLWNLINSNWMDQWNIYTSTATHFHHNSNERDPKYHIASGSIALEESKFVTTKSSSKDKRSYSFQSSSSVEETATSRLSELEVPLPPPAIDNNGLLLAGNLVLRSNLHHVRDFLLVPPLVWDALQAWYDGGPPIERKVTKKHSANAYGIDNDSSDHRLIIPIVVDSEVELYPFCLTIALADSLTGQPRPFQQRQLVSRIEPVQSLMDTLCYSLHMSPENARLWKIPSQTALGHEKMGDCRQLNLKLSLSEQMERSDEAVVIMLEVKRDDGIWPCSKVMVDAHSYTLSTARSVNRLEVDGTSGGEGDGIVGLHNMGNTCYLNSSMQCLSHTPLLREYFTSKSYLSDINTTNPLGYQGRLAQVSAMLLLQLWRPNASGSAVTPKGFKDALGKFNDIFAGNEQHDAQELLAFLLSGLSEDLNRIVDKPYIEQPDSDGRPDKELADIWWKNHLLREMSIIVALFTGQYKSLLTCKTCGYESARFEPFAFLQLPLQEDELIPVTMIVYPIDSSKPVLRYSVRVNKDGTIYDLLITLCKIIHQDELSLLRVSDHKVLCSVSNLELKRKLLRWSSTEASDNTDEDEEELNDDGYFYNQLANNFAVVDMRECRINSITPSSRSLSQVRESDILCVYEIDPIYTETQYVDTSIDSPVDTDEISNSNTSDEPASLPKPLVITLRSDYIALAQRRLEPIGRPYLHQFTMRVFGVPLLLRLVLAKYTGSQLYDLVAERMHRFLPTFSDDNSLEKSFLYNSSNSYVNDPPCPTEAKTSRIKKTTMDLVEVSGGTMPRHGFRLRLASRDGKRCSRCLWYECCIGCEIPDDGSPTAVQDGDTVVIDWHLSSPASRYRLDVAGPAVSAVKEQALFHACVERHRSCRFDGKDITLEECLDKFTKEEEIPDAYCSKCKDFRSSTKHMSVWRLPPIMIIHLKRFQFTQHFRRKLRNMVVFPVEGLDLSRIVASDDHDHSNHADTSASRNVSSRIIDVDKLRDDCREEDASWISNADDGRSPETLYDLYAVVHHLGALSGGHYVASVRSEKDGKWRIFNDAQVTEICSKDIVDASAYILFYIRRDMRHVKLEDVWDTSSRVGEGVTEDQIDKLVKQRSERCIIS